MALHVLRRDPGIEIVALLTTVTADYDRVSMHGYRTSLLRAQAQRTGLPLEIVSIGKDATNDEYETRMREVLERMKAGGVSLVAFGDIFLEDLRKYREDNVAKVGMSAVFPIWKRDTAELSRATIAAGFEAIVTCRRYKGARRKLRRPAGTTRRSLPIFPIRSIRAAENGEFHSFVCAGPIFDSPIACTTGEKVLRNERFMFCDVLPLDGDAGETR